MYKYKNCKAFSLLELSISIAIIALLIAGVVLGQNIVHRLRLNQIMEQIGIFSSSIAKFKEAYQGIPGDIYNAETLLGQTNIGDKLANNNKDGNGNGNNILENNLSSPSRNEELLFWQDLAAAGLITGSYDGVTIGEGGSYKASIDNGFYQAKTDSLEHNRIYVNLSTVQNAQIGYAALSAENAYNLDVKFDDGLPLTGNIRASAGLNLSATDCVLDNGYNLQNKNDYSCVLNFYLE